ncbi:MAG: PIG-L family deacetylase [Xanthomonadaceae bacterium]|nr:PIG-L family deacetylase [Xanthomonadaceae bacterium]
MKRATLAVLMMILGLAHVEAKPSPGSVVYIVAHPDDETLFGGTLGKLRENGYSVYGIYLTRGEGGKVNKVTGNPSDNYSMRPLELKKAAEIYGVKEFLLLNQPDQPIRDKETGKPSTKGEEFLNAKLWNIPWIKARVNSYLEMIRPKIILTLDPKSSGITHAHHQAVAQIVLESLKESKLSSQLSGVYGIFEDNYYLDKKFGTSKNTITFDTRTYSPALGVTYKKFQALGAAAHATQATGYMGELPLGFEKWEPLTQEKNGLIFRKLLRSPPQPKGHVATLIPREVRVIEEQAPR